ncbi:MAG: peptidoglycan DD-metalloendopeptidase family protein [Wenzhouxiangella sp.]|nr:peptidoglycan DD-metalloendopeptidase family protein [Wenzhouxiangella sp.]TVR97266.1 MAG: M23 family peptidase [Wenzhouxiangellaceae bacterium]
MRHRYLITITDYRGARHFTLSQLMRRLLAGLVCVSLLIVLGGSVLIHGLSQRVGQLNAEVDQLQVLHDSIQSRNQRLIAERSQLQLEVDSKTASLEALGDELEHIEIMIGLRAEPERPLAQRVDTASQTAFEKRLMLDSIPSGFPVESERITSPFGMRRHPIQERMAMHGGVDLRAPRGTPIFATADGVVEWASKHHNSGLGKMVKLVHNYGFSTVYGHLDSIEVQVGNYIKRGQLLGYSGSTGTATAPHLHYEVRHLNRRLDPAPFMRWSMDDYDLLFAKEDRVEWESLVEVIRRTASVPERPSLLQAQSWSATLP